MVRITRIIRDEDFRGWRVLWESLAGKLKPGEAAVVFNHKCDKARVYCAGGLYYLPVPPAGELFDIPAVIKAVRRGLDVELQHLAKAKRKAA